MLARGTCGLIITHLPHFYFCSEEWYSSCKRSVECGKVFEAMIGYLVLALVTIVIPRVTHLLALGDP